MWRLLQLAIFGVAVAVFGQWCENATARVETLRRGQDISPMQSWWDRYLNWCEYSQGIGALIVLTAAIASSRTVPPSGRHLLMIAFAVFLANLLLMPVGPLAAVLLIEVCSEQSMPARLRVMARHSMIVAICLFVAWSAARLSGLLPINVPKSYDFVAVVCDAAVLVALCLASAGLVLRRRGASES